MRYLIKPNHKRSNRKRSNHKRSNRKNRKSKKIFGGHNGQEGAANGAVVTGNGAVGTGNNGQEGAGKVPVVTNGQVVQVVTANGETEAVYNPIITGNGAAATVQKVTGNNGQVVQKVTANGAANGAGTKIKYFVFQARYSTDFYAVKATKTDEGWSMKRQYIYHDVESVEHYPLLRERRKVLRSDEPDYKELKIGNNNICYCGYLEYYSIQKGEIIPVKKMPSSSPSRWSSSLTNMAKRVQTGFYGSPLVIPDDQVKNFITIEPSSKINKSDLENFLKNQSVESAKFNRMESAIIAPYTPQGWKETGEPLLYLTYTTGHNWRTPYFVCAPLKVTV